MNMTLHHQKQRELAEGRKIKIGEDGRPYAENGILIVADGLGGRGGFPHTKINRQLLEREHFFEIAFGQEFEEADEEFKEFVLNSFNEFFDLKDVYFTSASAMRTSGYFASRLVMAIVLYELKTNPVFAQKEALFTRLKSLDGVQRDEALKQLGAFMANVIQTKLTRIAGRMGLELESKTKGSYLLPSTLTVALINDNEEVEDVEVLYLWAGDSRGYLWNKDGLAQITNDHEQNETMTNLITLTKPFQIEARLVIVKKPVVLFNATDGCYKCPCFASPLDLEFVLLRGLSEAKAFDDASIAFDKIFTEIGSHDDSNTIALLTFGYADFASLQADIQSRLTNISETILAKIPDIFERDYTAELERLESQREGIVFAVKSKLMETEEGKKFVLELMKTSHYEFYEQTLLKAQDELKEIDEKDSIQRANVERWVKWFWLRNPCLRIYSDASDKPYNGAETPYEICTTLEGKIAQYKQECFNCQNEIDRACEYADQLLESCNAYCDTDPLGFGKGVLKPYIQRTQNSLKVIKTQLKRKIQSAKSLCEIERRLEHISTECVERDKEEIQAFIEKVLTDADFVSRIEMSEKYREIVVSYLNALKANNSTRTEIEGMNPALEEKCLQKFWSDKASEIIKAITESGLFAEELQAISNQAEELEKGIKVLRQAVEVRQVVYDDYLQNYNRYCEESKL